MLVRRVTLGPRAEFGIRAGNVQPGGDELRISEEDGSRVRGQQSGEVECLAA
ncbi:hypothetical protein [Streptomyces sp. NPDC006355]|uniref:hypothetical protein n=1 Tax=Streptomyces sp. NPDC006355 TaxID=3156758 RepID=UPI0033A00D04